MAPEQLEGKEADARTDIFALGTLIYEMATGRKAFEAKSQASLIAAILEREPAPITTLQPMAPTFVDRLVHTCLDKNPDVRWQNAGDVARVLVWFSEKEFQGDSPYVARTRRPSRERLAWAFAAIAVVTAIGLAIGRYRQPTHDLPAIRFSVLPPEKTILPIGAPFSISPDGGKLAMLAAVPGGGKSLWVRRLDDLAAQPLAGTEEADDPFWSPDSRFIAFFAEGKLKKIALSGGPPQEICVARMGFGAGSWTSTDVILFGSPNGLQRVSGSGGQPIPVTTIERRSERSHIFPYFLPDGQHYLYLVLKKAREDDAIYLGSLNSKESRRLVATHWKAEYAAAEATAGHIFFVRDGDLMAQTFDARRLQLAGDPAAIAEIVRPIDPQYSRFPLFSASANDSLSYRVVDENMQLVWFDRRGKQLGTIDLPGEKKVPKISPDGKRIALEREDPQSGKFGIWLLDVARGATARFTFGGDHDYAPVWSPDSRRIIFGSTRTGRCELYVGFASGEGKEELLYTADKDSFLFPTDWSGDGRYVLYTTTNARTKEDLWVLPLEGDQKPFVFQQTQFGEKNGRFSPNGKWIAYTSDESGRWEVYVREFRRNAVGGTKWEISTQGGDHPIWRSDGKELFYIATDRKLMAVPMNGNSPDLGARRSEALFDTRTPFPETVPYAVTAGGERFLSVGLVDDKPQPITVVLNWTAGLKH
jgi:hypothetical protein